jgi:hypothetical protein
MSFTTGSSYWARTLKRYYGVTQLMLSSKLLAKPSPRQLIRCAALLTLLVSAPAIAQERRDPKATNPNAAAIKGFLDRANEYVALQKKVDDGLPKLSGNDNPSKIEANQAAMASRIKMARAKAKRGDIFGSAEPVLMAVIREDANLRTIREARAAMEEVPKFDPPAVNTAYPEKAALATVPPLLLNALPRLPEGLEYRFMGNDLILRDTKANLIPDFINNAVPTAAKTK